VTPDLDPGAREIGQPDSISRNTGFALAIRVASGLFTAGLTLFLVRALGPEDFGTFSLALGVSGLTLLVADFGIGQATARFLAEARGDPATAAAVAKAALRLKMITGVVAAIGLAVFAGPIADAYDTPGLATPLRVLAIAVFGQALMMLYDSMFEALGRISMYMRLAVLESAAETAASITLVLLGAGVTGAMLGRAAGYGVAAAAGLVLLSRTMPVRTKAPVTEHWKKILGYGSALLVIEGAFTLFSRIDVLLIGALVSVPAVAQFEAPMRLVYVLSYIGAAVQAGVGPRMAGGGSARDRESFERALRYLVLVQALMAAPLVVWAGPITDLALGPGYEDAEHVLRVLAPFAFLAGISPLLVGAVNYLGEARRRVPIVLAALGVNAAIDVLLLPEWGVEAAALGTDIGYGIYVGAHLWVCNRLLDLDLRKLVVPLVRALAAAAVMCGGLALIGIDDVALPLLVVGAIAGPVVYVLALLALREVSREELYSMAGTVRSLLPSSSS
jgi:O-antigen/teichoic acid export membrane protein